MKRMRRREKQMTYRMTAEHLGTMGKAEVHLAPNVGSSEQEKAYASRYDIVHGPPRPTTKMTVAELEADDIVGIYKYEKK